MRSPRGYAPDQRATALNTALADGDDVVVGAVLRGPGLLSELDGTQHARVHARWRQARHPEASARLR